MSRMLRVAAAQVTATTSVEENISLAEKTIQEAAGAGAQLVVLPEATMLSFATRPVGQTLDGPFATAVRAAARESGVLAVVGMFVPAGGRVTNTLLITDGRDVEARYDKRHLYDALGSQESTTVEAGEDLVVVEALGTKVGFATCYDVRFAEQFTGLGRRGAEVICLPASWAGGPGKAEQWELLVRARGHDAQAFVVAADQAGPADAGRKPLGIGCSLVVGPTGTVVASLDQEPGLLVVDIDLDEVTRTREALPLL